MGDWHLTVAEVAELLGISERAVRKNAIASKYGEVNYVESSVGGGKGGKVLRINLKNLPTEAQAKYIEKHDIGAPANVESSEYDYAPASQREVAQQRLEILKAFEAYLKNVQKGQKTKAAEQFATVWNLAHPSKACSAPTLRRWQAAYKADGISGLLPEWGKNKGKHGIDQAALEKFYSLTLTQRLKVAEAHRVLELLAQECGWIVPSRRTLQRIYDEIPAAVKVAALEGMKAYANKLQTCTRRDPDSIKGGEIFVGDHQRMDFSIIGPNGRPTRPWLTAWMDMRSGKLVGWLISFSPCTDTIIASFAEAALDPAIGLPRELYLDNGRDYCSWRFAGRGHRGKPLLPEDIEALKQDGKIVDSLMERLDIKARFAIPGNARAKNIERVAFGNITGWFYRYMPTYCGSNPYQKPADLEEKLKDLPKTFNITLERLNEIFSEWVRHVFNKRKSENARGRKGECPDETFIRTRLSVRTAAKESLQILFLKQSKPFKVGQNGITLYGREYYAPEMALLKGSMVTVRYRPADMSVIYVRDLDDRPICEARLLGLISANKATEEELKAEQRRKKLEKQAVIEHEAFQAARQVEPENIERVIELHKLYGTKSPDPQQTSVVEMLPLTTYRGTSSLMQATGTDGTQEINLWEVMAKNAKNIIRR